MDIFLIFPIHLFSNIKLLKDKTVYIIEEPRYFTDFKYHKLKLAYHRASMKHYFDFLIKNNIKAHYFDFKRITNDFYIKLKDDSQNICCYDTNDLLLNNKLKKNIKTLNILPTLNFLVDEPIINENLNEFSKKDNKTGLRKYNHVGFYKWQRIRLNILMDGDGKPTGGKWSFDEENRQKLPNGIKIPQIINLNKSKGVLKYIDEAINYVNSHFGKNYGSLDNFIYPINHSDAKKWLIHFCKNRFSKFGLYQDAVTARNEPFLFHSILTPMMNIGLLTDNEVLQIVLKYKAKIPIEAFEGFIRQIIGWRNYMYTIYLLEGGTIPKMNFFKHKRKLDKKMMWEGNTGIQPIDDIIHKINEFSYAHHIERLMYLGNYMLICMVKPSDVYEIFMEWTIDAYDWVMMANVYSMSQYADGGMIVTKPYFSSSNYILKMSDYKKGEWSTVWDALYYNFINVHKDYLSKNYGTARQVAHWNKKSEKDKNIIIKTANDYLNGKMRV